MIFIVTINILDVTSQPAILKPTQYSIGKEYFRGGFSMAAKSRLLKTWNFEKDEKPTGGGLAGLWWGGWHVTTASSVARTISRAGRGKPDCVLVFSSKRQAGSTSRAPCHCNACELVQQRTGLALSTK